MNQQYTQTPSALYARVSSDRQDVDLSVSAQLRALRDYAEKNGYVVARCTRHRKQEEISMNQQYTQTPSALYARVSSDRQDVDLSVSAQLRALRDYAEKNGYVVAREYVDEAESGRIADRPEFRKMIDEASGPNSPFQEIFI